MHDSADHHIVSSYSLPGQKKRGIKAKYRSEMATPPNNRENGAVHVQITFLAADGYLSSGITGRLDMFTIANMWQASLTGNFS